MACLGSSAYDPAAAVSKATSSLLAMTAIDTTNLRLTFTAPPSGRVLVRLVCTELGATTTPAFLLGVLDGATVKGRVTPIPSYPVGAANTPQTFEATFVVSGLTPGNSYTWDAAYGVETVVAATNIKYGGPNNTTGSDAWGAFIFEVWEAENCLGAVLYDPTTSVSKATTNATALAAFDTTNARITFTAPASGKVLWRVAASYQEVNPTDPVLGVLESATVRGRVKPFKAFNGSTRAIGFLDASGVISGLTPGNSYTFDAAWGNELAGVGSTIKYGGPNNTTASDAWGALQFEIWKA